MITPNKLGSIEIKVGAFVSGLGEDVVRKNLLVQVIKILNKFKTFYKITSVILINSFLFQN